MQLVSSSARYRITHRTLYRYPDPVAICQNQVRMMPRTIGNVQCDHVKCTIAPEPDSTEQHLDYFGNQVFSFAIESVHRELDVLVESEVTVSERAIPTAAAAPNWRDIVRRVTDCVDDHWLAVQEFTFDSPRVRCGDAFVQYARASFQEDTPIIEASLDLTRRIHEDFRYDKSATHVNTSTHDAFRIKAGVCQDFAHVQIACLRSIGLPARYVSGYLRTNPPPGKPRLVGADESHAWVSVYAGDKIGWVDLDPTNACLIGMNHIPVCIGRDYGDVSPMRGVVLGGGKTELTVSVDVLPIASDG